MTPVTQPDRAGYVTAEEFLTHPAVAGPSQLVRGEVRLLTPASGGHGLVAGTIFAAVSAFVEAHELGVCFPDNTGFALPGLPDTVRSPDMAYVRGDRLPPEGVGRGWVAVAPDLVVEVLSPTETPAELEAKLLDYRAAGTLLIWVIDPEQRSVSVRSVSQMERLLGEDEVLDGQDVLPGFAIPVARLFARLARPR